mmetsp:Transcript_87293/g.174345  ORF Transcript_87293/g.174345 Transcript_87293/m.174345 type:complete len:84 (+) Transcript_87293:132-383(+)
MGDFGGPSGSATAEAVGATGDGPAAAEVAEKSAQAVACEVFDRALPKLIARLSIPLAEPGAWDALIEKTAALAVARLLEIPST